MVIVVGRAREATGVISGKPGWSTYHFQAIQQQCQTQQSGLDILTWTNCFFLYIALMARKRSEMISSMVAHMHTVLKLSQKVIGSRAWYKYDVHFCMEMVASED